MSDFTLDDVRSAFDDEYEEGDFEDGIGYYFYEISSRGKNNHVPFTLSVGGVDRDATLIEYVDDDRPYESRMHVVFEIDGRMFKMEGRSISHDGDYWYPEDIKEVRRAIKEVVVYE